MVEARQAATTYSAMTVRAQGAGGGGEGRAEEGVVLPDASGRVEAGTTRELGGRAGAAAVVCRLGGSGVPSVAGLEESRPFLQEGEEGRGVRRGSERSWSLARFCTFGMWATLWYRCVGFYIHLFFSSCSSCSSCFCCYVCTRLCFLCVSSVCVPLIAATHHRGKFATVQQSVVHQLYISKAPIYFQSRVQQ